MPARDVCEPQVINALQKDGWSIVKKNVNLRLTIEGGLVFADLLISKADKQILIVEVKCFRRKRARLDELYYAIGQYKVPSLWNLFHNCSI